MRKRWVAIVMMLMLISSTGCQQNIGNKNLGDESHKRYFRCVRKQNATIIIE